MSHIDQVKEILPEMKSAVAARVAYEKLLQGKHDPGSPASLAQGEQNRCDHVLMHE